MNCFPDSISNRLVQVSACSWPDRTEQVDCSELFTIYLISTAGLPSPHAHPNRSFQLTSPTHTMDLIEELPTPETASSGVSTNSTTSTKSENPFFAGITYSKARSDIYESDEDPITPTTMQVPHLAG